VSEIVCATAPEMVALATEIPIKNERATPLPFNRLFDDGLLL
jgi:hypothetical protein